MSNQPGTPREDGEMGGNFLNPFQNESVSHFSFPLCDYTLYQNYEDMHVFKVRYEFTTIFLLSSRKLTANSNL